MIGYRIAECASEAFPVLLRASAMPATKRPTGVPLPWPRRSRIGRRMDLGPSRADEGRAWFGDDDIDGVHNLVGQVPILSTNATSSRIGWGSVRRDVHLWVGPAGFEPATNRL